MALYSRKPRNLPNPELLRILDRTEEFEAALLGEFPRGELPLWGQEAKFELAAASALIAIEHAGAIGAATSSGAMNSAAALLRLEYEAVIRATWLMFSATSIQVDKLKADLNLEAEAVGKNGPCFSDMLKAVERDAPAGLAAPLAEFNESSRHALNSFVHAGIHPLTRVRKGFPIELAAAVLRMSAGMLYFAHRFLAALTGSQDRMNRVTRCFVDFMDCLPMVAARVKPHSA